MFGKSRRPKLSRAQIEQMIAAVQRKGNASPTAPARGLPLGVAVETLDRVARRRRSK